MGLQKSPQQQEERPAATMVDDTKPAPPRAADTNDNDADPVPAVAPSPSGPGTAVAVQSDGSKFGALAGHLGFGAFPQVKLDKTEFVVGEEGTLEEFHFAALGLKQRWIYKRAKGDKENFFFTYDRIVTTQGQQVDAVLREWKSEGYDSPIISEYMEVWGRILDGEFEDRLVILSVPPASVPRLAAVQAELKAMHGESFDLDSIVMYVTKGAKITTRAKETFWPWKFVNKGWKADWKPAEKAE